MRKCITGFTLMLMLVGVGCHYFERSVNTPRKRWAIAKNTYETTARVLKNRIEAGKLDREDLQRVKRWNPIVSKALEEWGKALLDGDGTDDEADAFWRAMSHLDEVLEDSNSEESNE
jgi:hypothetical protein